MRRRHAAWVEELDPVETPSGMSSPATSKPQAAIRALGFIRAVGASPPHSPSAFNIASPIEPLASEEPRDRRVSSVPSVEARPIRRKQMAWKTPVITEIALGAEINSYACAELKA